MTQGPEPLTAEEIDAIYRNSKAEFLRQVEARGAAKLDPLTSARAIEAACGQKWREWLGKQEPVAWTKEYWSPDCGPYVEIYRDDEMGWRDRKEWTPRFLHPRSTRAARHKGVKK